MINLQGFNTINFHYGFGGIYFQPYGNMKNYMLNYNKPYIFSYNQLLAMNSPYDGYFLPNYHY